MLSANRAVMERYGDAWQRGDSDAAMACYSADVSILVRGRSRYAGRSEGPAAVMATILSIFAAVGAPIEVVIDDLLFSDKAAILIATETIERDGEVFTWHRVVHYRIEQARIVEISVYFGDQYVFDELVDGSPSMAIAPPPQSST